MQDEKEWTQDGALVDTTGGREGLRAVAGSFNRERSGRQVRLEPE